MMVGRNNYKSDAKCAYGGAFIRFQRRFVRCTEGSTARKAWLILSVLYAAKMSFPLNTYIHTYSLKSLAVLGYQVFLGRQRTIADSCRNNAIYPLAESGDGSFIEFVEYGGVHGHVNLCCSLPPLRRP